jgi:hypothetical protein
MLREFIRVILREFFWKNLRETLFLIQIPRTMKPTLNFLLFLTVLPFFACCKQPSEQIIGVKIYEYSGDCEALADRWAATGINTAFVSTTLAASDTFRNALRRHNIGAYIIFPVFQNPDVLGHDSSLYAITGKGLKAKDDWVEFVCPSRRDYRAARVDEIADLVHRLDPDGISIDFIRQFVFWEMIYPDRDAKSIDRACFCDSCLAEFSKLQGFAIPDSCMTTAEKAGWINTNYAAAYDSFRCGQITSLVRELAQSARAVSPHVKINVHAVPWRESDFGGAGIRVAAQDLHELAPYADFISPMCYSQMLRRDAGWIGSVVSDMDKRAPGMVLPSIQVYPYYIEDEFTAEDFRKCLREALKPPSRGVVFWSWPLLEQDVARMRVVKEEVKNEE